MFIEDLEGSLARLHFLEAELVLPTPRIEIIKKEFYGPENPACLRENTPFLLFMGLAVTCWRLMRVSFVMTRLGGRAIAPSNYIEKRPAQFFGVCCPSFQ